MTDDLTARLDAIRERANACRDAPLISTAFAAADLLPALVKAVDDVLALAAGSAVSVRGTPADCTVACVIGDCNCSGAGEPVAWNLDPAAIRSAVAAALAGEDGDGSPASLAATGRNWQESDAAPGSEAAPASGEDGD